MIRPMMVDATMTAPRGRNADPVKHLGYIDSLRGIALLMVVAYHSAMIAPVTSLTLRSVFDAGRYGVQLFYLISAFTLFRSMDIRARRDRSPVLAFAIRRVLRIGPPFWLAIAFYLWWYGLGPRAFAPGGLGAWHIALTALAAHAWAPDTINSVVNGGWSVGVEVSFYCLVPVIYRWARTPGRALFLLLLALAVAAVLPRLDLLGRFFPLARADHPLLLGMFADFWLPNQMPVFLLGLVLNSIWRGTMSPGAGAPARVNVDVAALAPVLAAMAAMVLAAEFLNHRAYSFAVAFFAVAWGLGIRPTAWLVNRATRWIGEISYGGYLAHFAAIDLVGRVAGLDMVGYPFHSVACERLPVVGGLSGQPPTVRLLIVLAAVLAITIPSACVIRRVVELPSGRLARKLIGRLS